MEQIAEMVVNKFENRYEKKQKANLEKARELQKKKEAEPKIGVPKNQPTRKYQSPASNYHKSMLSNMYNRNNANGY